MRHQHRPKRATKRATEEKKKNMRNATHRGDFSFLSMPREALTELEESRKRLTPTANTPVVRGKKSTPIQLFVFPPVPPLSFHRITKQPERTCYSVFGAAEPGRYFTAIDLRVVHVNVWNMRPPPRRPPSPVGPVGMHIVHRTVYVSDAVIAESCPRMNVAAR